MAVSPLLHRSSGWRFEIHCRCSWTRDNPSGNTGEALFMSEAAAYKAICFCGSVELELSGAPAFQGYCHCDSYKQWLGAPVNAATLWPTEAVKVTKGEHLLGTFAKTPRSQRKHCTKCGSKLLNAHYDEGLIDVFATTIRSFRFEPAMHVHYQERLMDVPDDLPQVC